MAISYSGRALEQEIMQAEKFVHKLLEELMPCLEPAKRPLGEADTFSATLPPVLLAMYAAVKASGDFTLTPMAAVAGSFADAVADFLVGLGAARVIVNNGGDIALRLSAGAEPVVVGLNPGLQDKGCSHTFSVEADSGIRGIATSGLGGRGFTLGVASAVTVLAQCSSVADACATSIANSTTVNHPAIVRMPAEKLDPQTDIRGQLVTVAVPSLELKAYEEALQSGITRAQQLLDRGIIGGAAICAGPYMSVIPPSFAARIKRKDDNLPGVGQL